MTDYITIGKKSNNFFYYTPINTKINFQVFKEYAESQKNKEINEELANLMNSIEQQIVSSNAFKALENKPIINQNKWNALKVKKTALTNICIVLNKRQKKFCSTKENFIDIFLYFIFIFYSFFSKFQIVSVQDFSINNNKK